VPGQLTRYVTFPPVPRVAEGRAVTADPQPGRRARRRLLRVRADRLRSAVTLAIAGSRTFRSSDGGVCIPCAAQDLGMDHPDTAAARLAVRVFTLCPQGLLVHLRTDAVERSSIHSGGG
jgi:hypothetical protein